MKIINLIILLILSVNCYSQNDTVFMRYDSVIHDDTLTYTVDTVIFNNPNARQFLYKTSILPNTVNQQYAKAYGLNLLNIEVSPCSKGERPIGGNEVISIQKTDSLWICDLKVIGNCCHDFLGDIRVDDDSTLNFINYSYGAMYCDCSCCFGLKYTIQIWDFNDLEKVQYVIINGDKKTLKKMNKTMKTPSWA